MNSLQELCITHLIEKSVQDIVLMDRLPYNLYEICKARQREFNNKNIPPTTKYILLVEALYLLDGSCVYLNQKTIMNCYIRRGAVPRADISIFKGVVRCLYNLFKSDLEFISSIDEYIETADNLELIQLINYLYLKHRDEIKCFSYPIGTMRNSID